MKMTRNDYLNRKERLSGGQQGFETPRFSTVSSVMLVGFIALAVLGIAGAGR